MAYIAARGVGVQLIWDVRVYDGYWCYGQLDCGLVAVRGDGGEEVECGRWVCLPCFLCGRRRKGVDDSHAGVLILAVGMIDGACHVCDPKLTYHLDLFSAFGRRRQLRKFNAKLQYL